MKSISRSCFVHRQGALGLFLLALARFSSSRTPRARKREREPDASKAPVTDSSGAVVPGSGRSA
jgi:hypothetical protein